MLGTPGLGFHFHNVTHTHLPTCLHCWVSVQAWPHQVHCSHSLASCLWCRELTIRTDPSTSEHLPHQFGLHFSTSSPCTPTDHDTLPSKSHFLQKSAQILLLDIWRADQPTFPVSLPAGHLRVRSRGLLPSMPCPFSAPAAPHSGRTSSLTLQSSTQMLCILLGFLGFWPTKWSLSCFQAWVCFYFLCRLYHQARVPFILKWKFQLKGFLPGNRFVDAPQLLHTQPPHPNAHSCNACTHSVSPSDIPLITSVRGTMKSGSLLAACRAEKNTWPRVDAQ